MRDLGGIPMRYRVNVDGRIWKLFSVDFETADGKYSTYIYAISAEHAEYILEELKATAKVSGEICGVYNEHPEDD